MTDSKHARDDRACGDVALIVGGGPGLSASCARLFAREGMRVVVAARDPEKPVLRRLTEEQGVRCLACDAAEPEAVAELFRVVDRELGPPKLVVHNIDGRSRDIFRKTIDEAEPALALDVLRNSAFSAFLVGQQAAKSMLANPPDAEGHRGTILYTNASAAYKGFPSSGAFAMACHGKAGLAESMARELGPQGIHVAHVPIDGGIGWLREDGQRAHWMAPNVDDNLLDPDRIAETYLHLHRQHRSTWAFEVVLRPWLEQW